MDAQKDGVVPVTMDSFAMKETVQSGVKISGDIKNPVVFDTFSKELLSIMSDDVRWKAEVAKGKKFAKSYYWKNIAKKWDGVFKQKIADPLVSVVTVTIREGWWNLMAHNLSQQTYKNFEWVIVDDYKEDRQGIADKYALKYGLNIKYIRGDKVMGKYKRKYGLVRANNQAWESSEGELCVFVQDFIVIPEDALESIVGLYRHNPDALIAVVDESFDAKEPNKDNKEDWWDGDTDIFTKFHWRNVRVKYQGVRETDNYYDFEMNYSAVPMKIIKHLNGWYEFFDDGMGYDNTEFAYRALKEGYKILIDDTNIAKCVNIGHHGLQLNTSGWDKFVKGNYPNVRDE